MESELEEENEFDMTLVEQYTPAGCAKLTKGEKQQMAATVGKSFRFES